MKTPMVVAAASLVIGLASLSAQGPSPLAALARMPIKEVTVFKDGHAFVLHEGTLPTDATGNVVMDYLPAPVLGTFWPYSLDKAVQLTGVTAGQRRVLVEETSLTLAELLAGNAGAEAIVTERVGAINGTQVRYAATIIGVPERGTEELAATGLPNAVPRTPVRAGIVLLRTESGVKVVGFDNILDVTFKTPPKNKVSHEEFRNLLTLQLDWAGRRPSPTTAVGLVYVQKGIRWIPSYRVTLDGKGMASLKLQATVLNELADFDAATANLVIGVPTFAFKDTTDPMALQQTAAQLSTYFQQENRSSPMSNALMSQVSIGGRSASAQAAADLGPALPEGSQNEDLFVFTLKNLTMKKGERAATPVAEATVPYQDVYVLDLPYTAPAQVRLNVSEVQAMDLPALASPQAMHKVRIINKGSQPLTTAPALILRDNRVLAQGTMTYTPISGRVDLDITKAVDIQVKKTDDETSRVPDAQRFDGSSYARVNLAGKITLTNYQDKTVEMEITRHVLGAATAADHNGVITAVNVMEDDSYRAGTDSRFWRWYDWPGWWSHVNGVGRIVWKVTLEPGKSVDLGYNWHYFWR